MTELTSFREFHTADLHPHDAKLIQSNAGEGKASNIFPFLKLAAETRNEIYQILCSSLTNESPLCYSPTCAVCTGSNIRSIVENTTHLLFTAMSILPFVLSCKQILAEFPKAYFNSHTFTFTVEGLQSFAAKLGNQGLDLVRNVRIEMPMLKVWFEGPDKFRGQDWITDRNALLKRKSNREKRYSGYSGSGSYEEYVAWKTDRKYKGWSVGFGRVSLEDSSSRFWDTVRNDALAKYITSGIISKVLIPSRDTDEDYDGSYLYQVVHVYINKDLASKSNWGSYWGFFGRQWSLDSAAKLLSLESEAHGVQFKFENMTQFPKIGACYRYKYEGCTISKKKKKENSEVST
ncbi:hypothetical protein EJ08DRAFT_732979 [Tothia fuscella]|uniref:Uncharacterized protein n=1 Tax=Tothia fuscella TaxID=1048955 RepID=A0A9P4NUG0_9PEZI|nr:hypothetical protein EJ08DRAFT_732979 [Tothia fuscella]